MRFILYRLVFSLLEYEQVSEVEFVQQQIVPPDLGEVTDCKNLNTSVTLSNGLIVYLVMRFLQYWIDKIEKFRLIRKYTFFYFFVVFFFTHPSYGQQLVGNDLGLRNNDLLPPEVQKIQEYGDYSLNHTKGMANISIPIFTIDTKTGLRFPISLDYIVSNGIKVEEIASNVGLGWMLNAFGVITVENDLLYDNGSSVKDDLIENSNNPIYNTESHTLNLFNYFERISFGQKKSSKVPIFHYSFLGHVGKFIIDNEGKTHGIPHTDLEITMSSNQSIIEIIDLDGNKYRFKKYNNFVNYIPLVPNRAKSSVFFVLNEITLSNKEKIEFFYDESIKAEGFMKHYQVTYNFDVRYSDLKGGSKNSSTGSLICRRSDWPNDIKTKVYGSNLSMRIKQIKYGDLLVNFKGMNELGELIDNYSFRKDLKGQLEAIKKVEIVFKNRIINSFDLKYSYFISDDTQEEKPEKYRLKLESITQNGVLQHNFEYYEDTKLPSRDSFAQDNWGYYNGSRSNTSLLSSVSFSRGDQSFSIPGSNRDIGSLATTRAFMLKRIQYPTKGYTDFSYNQVMEEKITIEDKRIIKGVRLELDIWSQESLYSKRQKINLRELGYNRETDSLYFVTLNDCDNNSGSINNHLSPSKSNGSITFSFKDGYYLIGGYGVLPQRGFVTTKNVYYGPMKAVGDEVDLKVFRMSGGECYVSGAISFERVVKDTIKTTKAVGPIFLSGYKSYDSTNKLEKEVFYQYKKVLNNNFNLVDVNYEAPVLVGLSERDKQQVQITPSSDVGQVLKNRKCVAIVQSSAPINNVKELYFPYIHEVVTNKGRTFFEYTGNNITTVATERKEPYYNYEFGSSLETDASWKKGYLLKETSFNDIGSIIKSKENKYAYDDSYVTQSKDFCFYRGISYHVVLREKLLTMHNSVQMVPNYYYKYNLVPVESSWIKKTNEVITDYTPNGSIKKIVEYEYSDLTLPRVKRTKFKDDIYTEEYTYPLVNSPVYKFKKGALLNLQTNKNGENLSTIENSYKNWGNNLMDLEEIKIKKGGHNIESNEKILFRDTSNGNIIELTKNGIKVVYLYGFSKTLPIAKIENASKEQVASVLGVTVANLVSIDESKMTQLNNLRTHTSLKEAMITTYEHQPLVGVTKIIDAKGQKSLYEYDESNRLKTIKDDKGNVLEEYEYNYKQ